MENSNLTLHGNKTPRTVVYKSESHKLHQAFPVGTGVTIVKGQPVGLEEDGSISPYKGTGIYLGIAVTDSVNPAYQAQRGFPVEVTVMVEGFAIVNGAAKATLEAGYVTTDGSLLNNRFTVYSASETETKFIALNSAEANELVQILVK